MIRSLRDGGRAVCVGLATREPGVSTAEIASKRLTIRGSFVMNVGEYEDLTRFMIHHNLNLQQIVTHRFAIEAACEAFETTDKGDCGKVIFEWGDS